MVCIFIQFISVQLLSRVWLFATPWITARKASLSITNSWSSLKFTSIESVIPSSHLILCHPFLLLLPIPPSIRVFSNESTLRMRWPKYWRFSFNISPSNEHPGLISFRMNWLDLLGVQGTLKSLLQHHSSKASILRCSAFFTVNCPASVYSMSSFKVSNGTPLQYSCLENPMDRGAWWATVHGVAKSRTRLSYFTFTFHFHALEKEMATHSSVLAWRVPGTGEPGGLPSMGSHRIGHDWSDLAAVAAML